MSSQKDRLVNFSLFFILFVLFYVYLWCSYIEFYLFFMQIAAVKAEVTISTGLQHARTRAHTSSQPLTWPHVIKSITHREQIDGSTVC